MNAFSDDDEEGDDITAEVLKNRSNKQVVDDDEEDEVDTDGEEDDDEIDEETVKELYNALKGSVIHTSPITHHILIRSLFSTPPSIAGEKFVREEVQRLGRCEGPGRRRPPLRLHSVPPHH